MSISKLPVEILRCIFEEVYTIAYANELEDDEPSSSHPHLRGDIGLANRKKPWSPYFIFVVCRQWRKIAKSLPLYAARWAMVFVDEPVSIPELEKKLMRSWPGRFKMFVLRKRKEEEKEKRGGGCDSGVDAVHGDDSVAPNQPQNPAPRATLGMTTQELTDLCADDSENDPNEKERVAQVIACLAPHIQRCQVLVIDVLMRSSLPCLSVFRGYSPKLRTLRLKSKVVDGLNPHAALTIYPRSFVCPGLQYLDLDGGTFIRAVHISSWVHSMRALPRKELSITNALAGDYGPFDLRDLIHWISYPNIGHLRKLRLCNIKLAVESCHDDGLPRSEIYVQNFEMEDLDFQTLDGFFMAQSNRIDVSSFRFTRCGLGRFHAFRSRVLYVHDSEVGEDELCDFVRSWDGFDLQIWNCAGAASERLIETLKEVDPAEHGDAFFASGLRRLSISPFPRVSVQTLKDLVGARIQFAKDRRSADRSAPPKYHPMLSISLFGEAPTLLPWDRKWFDERLDEPVIWGSLRARSRSPVLDDDCANWPELPTEVGTSPDSEEGPEQVADEDVSVAGTQELPPQTRRDGSESPPLAVDFSDMSVDDLNHLP